MLPLLGLSLKDVDKMEAKRDVQGLIKALTYKIGNLLAFYTPTGDAPAGPYKDNVMVRESAAEALGRIGDEKAVDALIMALKELHSQK